MRINSYLLLGFLCLLFSCPVLAQYSILDDDGASRSDNFSFFRDAKVELCEDVDCQNGTGYFIEVGKGTRFTMIDHLDDGSVVIKFWSFTNPVKQKTINEFWALQEVNAVFLNKLINNKDSVEVKTQMRKIFEQKLTNEIMTLSEQIIVLSNEIVSLEAKITSTPTAPTTTTSTQSNKQNLTAQLETKKLKKQQSEALLAQLKATLLRIQLPINIQDLATQLKNLSREEMEQLAVELGGAEIAGGGAESNDQENQESSIPQLEFSAQKTTTYYKVRPKDFTTKIAKRYNTWRNGGYAFTSGIIILPLKIRSKQELNGEELFDFSTDVSLGPTFGLKARMAPYRKTYLNAVFNIGVGHISLNDSNTRNNLSEDLDVVALTFASGLVFEFNNVQLGAFIGWDKISSKQDRGWIYQGKHWWSVGLGVPLFSTSTNGRSDGGKNTQ